MKQENILRMEQCPRFVNCSIPKCPLDEEMNERVEFLGDEICPLRRITEKRRRVGKLRGTVLTAKMKSLVKYVLKGNLVKSEM